MNDIIGTKKMVSIILFPADFSDIMYLKYDLFIIITEIYGHIYRRKCTYSFQSQRENKNLFTIIS